MFLYIRGYEAMGLEPFAEEHNRIWDEEATPELNKYLQKMIKLTLERN